MEIVETGYHQRVYEWKILEWKNLSPYDILLLGTKCSDEDIRKAYKFLSMKYHPDKNNTEKATEIFQKISTAYDAISTPEKRNRQYVGEIGKALIVLIEEFPIETTILVVGLIGITFPIICVQKCYSFVQWTYTGICNNTISGYNYLFRYSTDVPDMSAVPVENDMVDID